MPHRTVITHSVFIVLAVVAFTACSGSDDELVETDSEVNNENADDDENADDEENVGGGPVGGDDEPTVGERVDENGFFRLTGPDDEVERSDGVDGMRLQADCSDDTATFRFVGGQEAEESDVSVELATTGPLVMDEDDFGLPATGEVDVIVDIGPDTFTGTVPFDEYTGYPPPSAEFEIVVEGLVTGPDGAEHTLMLDVSRTEPCLSRLVLDDL